MKKWKQVLKEEEAIYDVKVVSGTKRKHSAQVNVRPNFSFVM